MQVVVIIGILITLSSCSSMRKTGLNMGAPLFYQASNNVLEEQNFENVDKGIAGSLLLLEGLRSVSPDNDYLTATLIKGFTGFAFAIDETKYLDDKYQDSIESPHKTQAIYHYSKAVRYGEDFLSGHDLSFNKLERALKDAQMMNQMNNELSDNDINFNAIFFTAQALGSLINLQRHRMELVAKLPLVKGLFDWVCTKKPEFNNGACDIFYASYESSRPKMLGGNPEKGKRLFLAAIKKWPNNYLVREAYLEHYAIPMSDITAYKSQVMPLTMAKKKLLSDLSWRPDETRSKNTGVGFYNSIAIKRFEIMTKYNDDLF